MNKNQIHGLGEKMAGKVQVQTGKQAGSSEQQAKGGKKQMAGNAEQSMGDAKGGPKGIRHAAGNK